MRILPAMNRKEELNMEKAKNPVKVERERADFRLPAVVPIVFYNGSERWTAVRSLKEYQATGGMFGDYVLNHSVICM